VTQVEKTRRREMEWEQMKLQIEDTSNLAIHMQILTGPCNLKQTPLAN